jgi:hypothetical protein
MLKRLVLYSTILSVCIGCTTSTSNANLTGAWFGKWASNNGVNKGDISFGLTQTGNTAIGNTVFSASPCFLTGTLNTTITGTSISGSITATGIEVTFLGTVSGGKLTGTYDVIKATIALCVGDKGTITTDKTTP